MRALVLVWLLAGCADNDSGDNCACTISVDAPDDAGHGGTAGTLTLGCGKQGCLEGHSYGCDNDNVLMLGVCGLDMTVPPVTDDMGTPVCYPFQAVCQASLPCCPSSPAATCDPVTSRCCVPTGSPCTTTSDCCAGKSCVPIGGQNVCGS